MSEPPVAVVLVAMDDEAAPFLDLATEQVPGSSAKPSASPTTPPERVGRAEHRHLTLAGRPVVLVRTGIGSVNASAAGASAILRYGADVPLISAGSAGGLAQGIAVGDVVLGTRLVNADADARAFGYVLGQVPGMPQAYDAAPRLTEAARKAAVAVGAQALREGTVGSSEKFATTDVALGLRTNFPDMLAIDMESAALAQLCHSFGTDFVSVRAVSDLCAPDGTEFLTHIDDAAQRSARVVTAMIGLLAG